MTETNDRELSTGRLTLRKIFIFWYPLAATWLMMAIENPYLAAIIARLPEAEYNLAAFGAAFSFALIIEAPLIMIMSASTALINDRNSFLKLRRFTYFLNGGMTGILLILLAPPVFNHITGGLMELPPRMADLTYGALLLLAPWPAAIGYRRFYQGILIRSNLTRRVAYGTVVRLVGMTVTAITLFYMRIPGAYTGAAALSVGVIAEGIAARLMTNDAIKRIIPPQNPDHGTTAKPLTYKSIALFYYPLALMSTLSLGVHPLVTAFMAQGRMPLESLAVMPVVNALIFIFRSMGLSYLEVVVTLLRDKARDYPALRNFALILAGTITCMLALILFTPLAETWFHRVSGLSIQLTVFAYLPGRLMLVLPALAVIIALQRGVLVNSRHTKPITWGTTLEVAVIVAVLVIGISYLDVVGAAAAASAFTLGRLAANLYFIPHQLRAIKST